MTTSATTTDAGRVADTGAGDSSECALGVEPKYRDDGSCRSRLRSFLRGTGKTSWRVCFSCHKADRLLSYHEIRGQRAGKGSRE